MTDVTGVGVSVVLGLTDELEDGGGDGSEELLDQATQELDGAGVVVTGAGGGGAGDEDEDEDQTAQV